MTTVADQSLAVLAMSLDWHLAESLLGGTRKMRERGTVYLPRWPKEDEEAYKVRLSVSVLFPAYLRTIQTLAAKPFTKPITIGEDVPARFEPWLADIDLQGRDINAFCADLMEIALGYGMGGILVDFPPAEGVRTQAQEQAAGLRPYWVMIRPQQILGWRSERIVGSWRLLQLRLMEAIEIPDGEFGSTVIEQVRVLEPGKWATYRKDVKGTWAVYESGTTSLAEIPFVPVYGQRLGFMLSKPPLIEVAHLNVAHWQSSSDQQNILHVVRVPILTVTGIDDEKWTMTVGASTAVKLPADSVMQFVEHSGAAIAAGVTELDKLEERMRQAGAELLVLAPGRITATQIHTENAVGMCVLQQITQAFEDAVDSALQLTADWVSEPTGGHVTLFNDYGVATLAEASAQLLLQTNQAGKLSDETLHSEYQRRGILSADVLWIEEQERLASQGPALGELTGTGTEQSPTGALQAPPRTGQIVARTAPPVETASEVVGPAEDDPEGPEAPEFDFGALLQAISNITFPAPIINIPAALPPQITVEAPTINVTVPEQAAPVVNISPPNITVESPTVNIAPAAVTVNVPEQAPPVVNVAQPAVNVTTPPVNVTIEKNSGRVSFTEDDNGRITGAELQ